MPDTIAVDLASVKGGAQHRRCTINAADFDPTRHVRWDDERDAPAASATPTPDRPTRGRRGRSTTEADQ